MKKQFKTDDYIVSYDASAAQKTKVFNKIIEFFKEHESFSGECVMQNDGPLLAAPELLADLLDDVIKFELRDKDE